MADGITFKVRRKDELFKKLGQTVPAIFAATLNANRQAADEMVELAQQFVPVDSGDLRASIVATGPGGTPPSYSQGGGGAPVPAGSYAVSAGNTKVRYAHLVEYGTKSHPQGGKFAGTDHPGTPARPFFWPAYRLIRAKHLRRMGRIISKEIKLVFGK